MTVQTQPGPALTDPAPAQQSRGRLRIHLGAAPDGNRNAKRWQDVEELLAAGIDVVATVDVQELESLAGVVEQVRERIAVALSGEAGDEVLIRRAARIAARTPGSELLAVHVVAGDAQTSGTGADLTEQRRLIKVAGGVWHDTVGRDVAIELAAFTRTHQVTQLVLGDRSAGRLSRMIAGPGVGAKTARMVEHVDVHLIARNHAAEQWDWRLLGKRRRTAQAEADAVKELASAALSGAGLPELLEVVRDLLGLDAISLLEPRHRIPDEGDETEGDETEGDETSADTTLTWHVMACAGDQPPEHPTHFTVLVGSEGRMLAARSAKLDPARLRALVACSDLIASALKGILRTAEPSARQIQDVRP